MKNKLNVRSAARCLYDSGWRSSDREQLVKLYGHAWTDHGCTPDEMHSDFNDICALLDAYAESNAVLATYLQWGFMDGDPDA